jgi:hypothetical protein
MHRLIADAAGHHAIAEAMTFADHSVVELERLQAERALERRQRSGAKMGGKDGWQRSKDLEI